eukprot:GHRQ01033049.1.p1 GENE.GHRQ01033049.1~~GHRQ01033049.1.p1  ORF type:complete len:246 (-),score=60.81 GHRQ01033049.1:62-799(-)
MQPVHLLTVRLGQLPVPCLQPVVLGFKRGNSILRHEVLRLLHVLSQLLLQCCPLSLLLSQLPPQPCQLSIQPTPNRFALCQLPLQLSQLRLCCCKSLLRATKACTVCQGNHLTRYQQQGCGGKGQGNRGKQEQLSNTLRKGIMQPPLMVYHGAAPAHPAPPAHAPVQRCSWGGGDCSQAHQPAGTGHLPLALLVAAADCCCLLFMCPVPVWLVVPGAHLQFRAGSCCSPGSGSSSSSSTDSSFNH